MCQIFSDSLLVLVFVLPLLTDLTLIALGVFTLLLVLVNWSPLVVCLDDLVRVDEALGGIANTDFTNLLPPLPLP